MKRNVLDSWRVISSTYPLSNRWLRVRMDCCLTPSNVEVPDYYVVERPDFVMVFAVTDTDEVVTVRQYKHGVGRVAWELPAGQIDEGEAPEEAARRELFEETGYWAENVEQLGDFDTSPSTATNKAWAFLCRPVRYRGGHEPDAVEEIMVERIPLADFWARLGGDGIRDAASLAVSLLALRRLTASHGVTRGAMDAD